MNEPEEWRIEYAESRSGRDAEKRRMPRLLDWCHWDRDCDPAAIPQVRVRLEAELGRLKDLCTSMPIELVSGVAEGADTIASEAALEHRAHC